ncbi:hypothetical protein BDF14DRAFT_1877443 [Spinellus fusiger]|nr:hypothetical protein BDF14DRAFT_1877443 [Spinellus fusiger]
MAPLTIRLKLANTLATVLLVATQALYYSHWFPSHPNEIQARDSLFFLLWLPKAPKGNFVLEQQWTRTLSHPLFLGDTDTLEAIGYWYLLVTVLNGSAVLLWHYNLTVFALVALLWQLATLLFVYHHLRDYPPRNNLDMALVNAPFSIYTAFTLFAVFWQLVQWYPMDRGQSLVPVIVLSVIGFVALHLVDYSHRQDWVWALTTVWILLGAAVFTHGLTHTAALVITGILLSAIARVLIPGWLEHLNRSFGRWTHQLGERTPLLSHH